jgi:large conductance mechanosensitive channel protein
MMSMVNIINLGGIIMLKEFKEFLMRGNVVDLAVAVIIGAAFKAIVDSLVKDIFEPIIAMVFKADSIAGVSVQIGSATLGVGAFAAAIINFVIVGFVLFMVVKGMNTVQGLAKSGKEEAKEVAPEPKAEDYLREIRDLLANK